MDAAARLFSICLLAAACTAQVINPVETPETFTFDPAKTYVVAYVPKGETAATP